MRNHEDESLAALGLKQYHYQAQKGCFFNPPCFVKKRQLELAEKVADVGQEDFTHRGNAMSHKAQKMISSKASSGSRGSGQQMALDQNMQRGGEEVQVWCGKHGFLSSTFLSCQQMAQMR